MKKYDVGPESGPIGKAIREATESADLLTAAKNLIADIDRTLSKSYEGVNETTAVAVVVFLKNIRALEAAIAKATGAD